MIEIEYDPDKGLPIADGRVETYYDNLCYSAKVGSNQKYTYANSLIFSRIRLGIVKDEISCENIVFIFRGERLTINPCGVLEKYPKGFCDREMDISFDIVRTSVLKRRSLQSDE